MSRGRWLNCDGNAGDPAAFVLGFRLLDLALPLKLMDIINNLVTEYFELLGSVQRNITFFRQGIQQDRFGKVVYQLWLFLFVPALLHKVFVLVFLLPLYQIDPVQDMLMENDIVICVPGRANLCG